MHTSPHCMAFITSFLYFITGNLEATVTDIQSAKKVLKETRLKASRFTPVESVLVTNITNEECNEDMLRLYFKNKKNTGGGKLHDVIVTAKGQAIVTFQEPEGVCVCVCVWWWCVCIYM